MQKDYRQVYKTYKSLLGNHVKINQDLESIDLENMAKNYLMYVQLLTIFAAGHFNFETDPQLKIDMNSLDISFVYKGWKLDIFSNNKKEVILDFTKDKTFKNDDYRCSFRIIKPLLPIKKLWHT